MSIGRPTKKTPEIIRELCEFIANGGSLREWCREEGNPDRSTVLVWLNKDPAFQDQYAQARELQADYFADEILAIADNEKHDYRVSDRNGGVVPDESVVSRSRLQVDTRKWLMARMAPKKYGDRVLNEHTGKDGGPIETRDLSKATTDQLLKAHAILDGTESGD